MKTTTSSEKQRNSGEMSEERRALLEAMPNAMDSSAVEAPNRVRNLMDTAGETCARVKAKAIEGAKVADKGVRENPYTAVAVAFGLGTLLGFMLPRRGRD